MTLVKIWQKMMGNNPKLDLVSFDKSTKFGQILSFHSQDIEQKQNSDVKICSVLSIRSPDIERK